MNWALLGILLGVILGLIMNVSIPIEYTKYTAVTIVGILDAMLGATKEELNKKNYNASLFATGLAINIALALLITLLGEQLGLDLYLAVAVVFTFRIFSNLGIIRRSVLKRLGNKKKK